jgi:hypothetical protein
MTISNNTQHASIYYSVSHKGGVDCGNLDPGDDAVMPSFDDSAGVKVTLTISKTGDETTIEIADPGLLKSSPGESVVE